MAENEKEIQAYTFAVTGFPLRPLITRRRKERFTEFAEALNSLEGLIGVFPCGRELVLLMRTENDTIIAKNRLANYYGFPCSVETYRVKAVFTGDGYDVYDDDDDEGDAP